MVGLLHEMLYRGTVSYIMCLTIGTQMMLGLLILAIAELTARKPELIETIEGGG